MTPGTVLQRSAAVLGVALLAGAGLWHFSIAPRYTERLPKGWTWRSHFVGTMTYADPKSGVIPATDVVGYYDRAIHVVPTGDSSGFVRMEDVNTVLDPETNRKTWEYIYRATVDSRTGQHVRPEYAGDYYVFPRAVEKKTYRLRQNYLEGAPLAFQREEMIEDVLTYLFAYRGSAEYTKSYTTGTPEFPPFVVPKGQEIRCADDQFVFRAWVEPVTGEIVKLEESCRSGDYYYDVKSGQRLGGLARWAGVSAGDDVRVRLQSIRVERRRVQWMGRYLTWALLMAGTFVLGWSWSAGRTWR